MPAPATERVYVIPHFRGEDGRDQVILGKEAAVSGRALFDLRQWLQAPQSAAAAGRFARLVKGGRPLLRADTGGCVVPGKWAGRNFSGVLLLGRAAFAGGRVERGESTGAAAVRELVEEFKLDRELLRRRHRDRLQRQLRLVERVEDAARGRRELYCALDLDAVDADLAQWLAPRVILDQFEARVPRVADLWAARAKHEPDLQIEKRSVFAVPASALAEQFGAADSDDLEFLQRQMDELACVLCHELGVEDHCANLQRALLRHQMKRNTPQLLGVAGKFVEYLNVSS